MLPVVGKTSASRLVCGLATSGRPCVGSLSSVTAAWPYNAALESSSSLQHISCCSRRQLSLIAPGRALLPTSWLLQSSSIPPFQSHSPQNSTISLISSLCGHFVRAFVHTTPIQPKSRTASNKKKNYFMGVRIEKSRVHPMLKHKYVILLDEKGTVLEQLDSKTALGIVEGNRLEVKLVRKDEKTGLPIFKMISKKALYDEEKLKKKLNKRNRHDVIKEFKIGSKIAEHDLSIKIKKAKEMLDKGYSVRIIVELKISMKRATPELIEAEEKARRKLAEDLVERLNDASSSHIRNNEYGKRKDVCVIFRPVKKLKVGDPGMPKEEEELVEDSEVESEGDLELDPELDNEEEEADTDGEDLERKP